VPERRVIHAWVKAHKSDCEWYEGRRDEDCTCGAEPFEVEVDFVTPSPRDDERGFIVASRRAVIAGALEMVRGEQV
jgi:hypothetical protein